MLSTKTSTLPEDLTIKGVHICHSSINALKTETTHSLHLNSIYHIFPKRLGVF